MEPAKVGDLPADTKPVDTPEVPAADPVKEPEVSKDLYEKFKADAKAAQEALKATQDQLEEMKMAKLRESKNWQEIARIKEEEATQAKKEREDLKKAIINQQKSIALRAAANKAGINPLSLDDLDLLDFDEVQVETTSQGKILINGADAAIMRLKTLRPNWFLKNPSAVNPSSPEVKAPAGAVDLKTLFELEKEYKKNPQSKEALKAYTEAIKQYNSKR